MSRLKAVHRQHHPRAAARPATVVDFPSRAGEPPNDTQKPDPAAEPSPLDHLGEESA
jgi:hypothetical protein